MDWAFDIRSAIAFGAATTLLIAGLLLLSWRSLPEAVRPSLRWWLGGLLLHALGSALLATRGAAPTWVSIVLANGVLGLAFSSLAIALRGFYGQRLRRMAHAALVAGIAGVALWFTRVYPDPSMRTALLSLLLATPLISAARVVFRQPARPGRVARLTAVGFGSTAGLLLACAAVTLLRAAPTPTGAGTFDVGLLWIGGLVVLPPLATVGFLLMCTEQAQAELERSARLDYLTGLFNRRAMDELAAAAISAARRHGQPLAILLVDVDHFKDVNDVHGHEAGDAALVEAVRRMRGILRSEDMLGRQGGEEFVALMPGVDLPRAGAVAERLRASFADQAMCLGDATGRPELGVTVSIGVAALRPDDLHWSKLLRRADRAMYAAKAAGRNTVCVDPAG